MTITFTEEELDKFNKLKFGWVTPEGSLLACGMYDHYKVLPAPYAQRYQDLYEDANQSMHDQVSWEAEQSGDEYYHPSMHRFDPDGDARETVEQELYQDGYIRIGSCEDGSLDCHGTKGWLKTHFESLKFLFEIMGGEGLWFTYDGNHKTRNRVAVRKD